MSYSWTVKMNWKETVDRFVDCINIRNSTNICPFLFSVGRDIVTVQGYRQADKGIRKAKNGDDEVLP